MLTVLIVSACWHWQKIQLHWITNAVLPAGVYRLWNFHCLISISHLGTRWPLFGANCRFYVPGRHFNETRWLWLFKSGNFLNAQAAHYYSPYIIVLATIAILYGAFATMMQKDLKYINAYSSVSHCGFVLLGNWHDEQDIH
jgi:hypothetical protein